MCVNIVCACVLVYMHMHTYTYILEIYSYPLSSDLSLLEIC